jgi:hypothetical protein
VQLALRRSGILGLYGGQERSTDERRQNLSGKRLADT